MMESQDMEISEDPAENVASTSVEGEVSESKDEASGVSTAPRERCKYGASCYRRNEDHKKQFSHPNDPDYNVTSVAPDGNATSVAADNVTPMGPDNRPECKYGTLCYRQNPQHKKDFKHTSLPVKNIKRKKVAKVKKEEDSDQESSDDYDYDDSFLNDDSSDDYQPTSSSSDSSSGDDEEMEDDTKRTLREGKKFTKR